MAITAPAAQTVVTESVATNRLNLPLQQPSVVDVSGLAQGIMSGGEAIERANLQLSQIRLSEAETEVMRRTNARLYEDDDAFFKLNGKESVESLDGRMQEVQDIQNEVSGTLKTGTEKRLFANALASRQQQNRVKMSLRSFDERQQWDRSTAAANIGAQLESAANDPSPENLKFTKARIQEEAATIARVDGMPPEQQAEAANKAVSGMFRTAIETVAVTDPFEAKEMLDRFSEDVQASDKLAINKILKENTLAAEARKLADGVASSGGDLSTQLATIGKFGGKTPSPRSLEIQERARQKATLFDNQLNNAKNQRLSDNFDDLGERVIAGAPIDQLQALFPEKFDDMSTANRATLERLEKQETPVTDWATYSRVLDLAQTDPVTLSEIEPMSLRPDLGDTEFVAVSKLIAEAKGKSFSPASLNIIGNSTRIKNKADIANIDLDEDEGVALVKEVQERIDTFSFHQKRPPQPSEIDDIIDDSLIRVVLPPVGDSFFRITFRGKSIFESNTGREISAFEIKLSDIQESERNANLSALTRAFGRPPTENEQIDFFVSQLSSENPGNQ